MLLSPLAQHRKGQYNKRPWRGTAAHSEHRRRGYLYDEDRGIGIAHAPRPYRGSDGQLANGLCPPLGPAMPSLTLSEAQSIHVDGPRNPCSRA